MSAAPSLEAYAGRAQPMGPMDFNAYLEQPAGFFDEEGNPEQMSLHAVVSRGEEIARALDGRVQKFLGAKLGDVLERKEVGQALVDQYETLCGLVEHVKSAVEDFSSMYNNYDVSKDRQITGSFPVMNNDDAFRIKYKFETFVKRITDSYLSRGKVNTYLADRISTLKATLA